MEQALKNHTQRSSSLAMETQSPGGLPQELGSRSSEYRQPASSSPSHQLNVVQQPSPAYLGGATWQAPASTQGSDTCPFAFTAPAPSTGITSLATIESSLPVTPTTAFPLSTHLTYEADAPVATQAHEPPNSGISSTFGFAFRPPTQPARTPLSASGRPDLTSAGSYWPRSRATGLAGEVLEESPPESIPQVQGASAEYEKSAEFAFVPPTAVAVDSEKYAPISPSPGSEKAASFFNQLPFTPAGGVQNSGEGQDDTEDSPFPEVRASVSNFDDPDMPCLTFRAWFVGIVICLILSSANMFFYVRNPAPYWTGPAVVIVGYFGGKLLEKTMPLRYWTIWGYEFSLNPGPFNIKEHTLIYMLGGLILDAGPVAYGMHAIVTWEKRYNQALSTGFDFLFLLSSQLLGFALVGLCHRLLVWPASAIWPTNLSTCATLNALHAGDDAYSGHRGPKQAKVFAVVTIFALAWAFLPGYLFTALSYFSILCWIFPKVVVVNQLFGPVSGLGMNIITFDWTQINIAGSPMAIPFWAQLHLFGTFVVVYWIVAPVLYYKNVWNSAHFPIFGRSAYDRFGRPYNVSRVLDFNTLRFNETAYQEYSPVYLPISFAMTYLLGFAVPPAILIHTILVYWPKIWSMIRRLKAPDSEPEDIHAKLMRRYPQVPRWWYTFVFVVSLLLSIHPELLISFGAVVLSIIIAVIWVIPVCYISAISGQPAAINLLAQIVPGAIWPERPFLNMSLSKFFKSYCIQGIGVAAIFVKAVKLGHYMKVPPKDGFTVQAFGIVLTTLVQTCVKVWIFAGVPDICQPDQPARLVCSNSDVFYTSSIVWGLIGPARQFGKGAVYYGEIYALVGGALFPLFLWGWRRFYPATRLKKFNLAVALTVCTFTPPATGITYASGFVVGCISQWYIRTRKPILWSKYNYIVSGAMDSGQFVHDRTSCFSLLEGWSM
ncbi:hypothetical protein FS837_011784 [Tulasnella sp. UAMH 9824]|nr:hypothetical protein FS837_011784 [Tulasnella sp. UAMH 9824]